MITTSCCYPRCVCPASPRACARFCTPHVSRACHWAAPANLFLFIIGSLLDGGQEGAIDRDSQPTSAKPWTRRPTHEQHVAHCVDGHTNSTSNWGQGGEEGLDGKDGREIWLGKGFFGKHWCVLEYIDILYLFSVNILLYFYLTALRNENKK